MSFVTRLLLCSQLLSLAMVGVSQGEETALDKYVRAPDPAYRYQLIDSVKGEGATVHRLRMTSQTWLTENEVDAPLWWHWLNLYEPDEPSSETALLYLAGGNTESENPRRADEAALKTAISTGCIVAELRMVPNQPLVFNGDGVPRYEDDLIAYGWKQSLETGKVGWLPRLPMTKSAVRAMDTVTDFFASPERGERRVEKFVVAGASKRGWTAWTTAAVDDRVVAVVPIVIDMLNMAPSFAHHFGCYGFFSPAVHDYVDHGILNYQGTPEYAKLTALVDPYEYRSRLTMPKLIITATGDEFFVLDSHRFYFGELTGPKLLRCVPNTNHSLEGSDAVETVAAWQYLISSGKALPKFGWNIDRKTGAISVKAGDTPSDLQVWQAHNPTARDFRDETIGKTWQSHPIEVDHDGTLVASVEKPKEGWTAFFVEATYRIDGFPNQLKVTSGISVIPDLIPFAPDGSQ